MADRWTAVETCQCLFFAYVALQVPSPGSSPQTDCQAPPLQLSPLMELELSSPRLAWPRGSGVIEAWVPILILTPTGNPEPRCPHLSNRMIIPQ